MKFEINTEGKGLFLTMATISLILIMAVTTVLWWFISPRLHEINGIFAQIALNGLRGFYLIVITGIVLVLMTCYLERNFLISKFAVRLSINFIFPISIFWGRFVGISKDRIRESFVHVNNAFVNTINSMFKPSEVLILLPHCLQNNNCEIRITNNYMNCKNCGKCDIGDLKNIAIEYKVHLAIATGGTLARRIIVKIRPKFIIAVACQRDLVDGIQDVFPIPVYGVLNERPEGPCVNTRVNSKKIKIALDTVLVNNLNKES